MKRSLIQARILRALAHGPLYVGVLPLIVDASDASTRAALAELVAAGRVRRIPPATFALPERRDHV